MQTAALTLPSSSLAETAWLKRLIIIINEIYKARNSQVQLA